MLSTFVCRNNLAYKHSIFAYKQIVNTFVCFLTNCFLISSGGIGVNIVERVKILANEKKMSIAELERKLDLGAGTISRWDTRTPGIDKVGKVADFFDVSTDYLLGRSEKRRYYDLTEKDEKDIQKRLEEMIEDLSTTGALAFSKDTSEIDRETRELLLISLENSLRIAKIEAKKRFTPKKYREKKINEDDI